MLCTIDLNLFGAWQSPQLVLKGFCVAFQDGRADFGIWRSLNCADGGKSSDHVVIKGRFLHSRRKPASCIRQCIADFRPNLLNARLGNVPCQLDLDD